ncbi:MAG: PKD domain-containing protein [Candidatus Bipolaricaulaceae bacterium]
MKRVLCGALMALVLGLLALGQEEAVPLGIVVEPPAGELTVRIWVDKPVYSLGETVRINFELSRPAYVYIWDITPDGKVTQIFPNQFEPQNYFPAGVHSIPGPGKAYQFRVTPPTGTEWLQIMATTVPIPYFQGYSPQQPFPLLGPDPQSWQEQLKAQVLGLVPEPTQRAFDFTSFQIVSGAAPGYGTLQVTTNPPQAKLYVDGVFRGYTPRTLLLTVGSHTVLLRKAGYQDYTTTIYLFPGGTRTLNITLIPMVVNQPPVAQFTFAPTAPRAGDWIQFDASPSSDPDGTITNYQWDFQNDGTFDAIGKIAFFRYPLPGTYTVRLVVTDDKGASGSAIQTVVVSPLVVNQPPVAQFTYSPTAPFVGQNVIFNGTGSYDPDGAIVSYQWDLNGDGVPEQSGPVATWTYTSAGVYTVTLTVMDNQGATNSATKTLTVLPLGIPGMPPTYGIPGIYVWGTDRWYITVNGSPTWTWPHAFRVEIRTDGEILGLTEAPEAAPLGLVPEPISAGWQVVREGTVSTASITYAFEVRGATTIYFDLRLDMDGDGTLEILPSLVRLRQRMVSPPTNPFVVGTPEGYSGPFVPSLDFRIGRALVYTQNVRIIFWQTSISALEGI